MPTRQSEKEERIAQDNPFKRGSMKFDDFNYKVYNPYILVKEEQAKHGRRGKREHVIHEASREDDANSRGLSVKQFPNLAVELPKYQFESLSVKTPEDKFKERKEEL